MYHLSLLSFPYYRGKVCTEVCPTASCNRDGSSAGVADSQTEETHCTPRHLATSGPEELLQVHRLCRSDMEPSTLCVCA